MTILTLDIGGSEIKAAHYQTDGSCSKTLPNQKTAVSAQDNHIGTQIVQICREEQTHTALQGVAISSAGVIDPYRGTVLHAGPSIPGYSGTALKQTIENQCGLPCSVENDVNAMALGEAWLGAAQNSSSALCLTLGTGLGGAILLEGKLWRGANYAAGEIGVCPLGDGRRLEQAASTTALLATYAERRGEHINGKTLFQRLRAGDADAAGLLPAIHLLAPETLLIGGGIAAQHDLIEPRIRAQLAEKLPAQHFMPKNIRCASLGNRAGMIGALRWFLDSRPTRPQ